MKNIQSLTKNITIRTKLIFAFSLIGISITILVNYINYTTAKRLLQEEIYSKLIAVREIKKTQVQDFIQEKVQDIHTLANGADVRILFEHLVQYHYDLQVGAREAYDVSTPAYQDIAETYGGLLTEYIEMYGYLNIYLLCSEHGHVMFSAAKGDDSGTNLQAGPFRESALATLWSRVIETQDVILEDFQAYAPLHGKPVAFIGTPVTSQETGEIAGVVALQISVEELDKIMSQRSGLGETGETYLVGTDRRMRSNSLLDPEQYSAEASFREFAEKVDSEAIRYALDENSGIALIENYRGIPVLSAYTLLDLAGGVRWALLAEIDEKEAFAKIDTLRNSGFFWGAFFVGIVAIGAILFAQGILTPLKTAARIANQVSEGKLDIAYDINSQDEVGQVLMAMEKMVAYLQEVADVAEKISNNELEIEVVPRSDQDTLNHSLTKMIVNLQKMTHDIEASITAIEEQYNAIKDQNWSKDGLSRLSAALSGNYSLADLCQIAIRTVARYVKAGQGVVYVFAPEEKTLSLQASFAFTERDGLSRCYTLGENVIGQVAQERKAILLKHADREERFINSALISQTPLNTYALPLVYNDELFGVAELASFETFGEKEQEFLTQAADIIATAIFSAQQRTRNEELLRQAEQALQTSKEAQEKAQERSRDAQRANARLEEQQQQLQQQNEEFQQLAAQLKEQQQHNIQDRNTQEQLAQRLEQEQRLLRNLVDNLPDFIYAKDRQSRFILVNQFLAHSSGFSRPEEMLGKTDFDLQPQALAETFYRAEQSLMQSGQEMRDQEEIFENETSGEKTWLLSSKIPFQDQHGEVAGLIGIGRNITERRRAKEALRELNEQFEQQLQERSANLLQEKEELEQRVRELESG